MIRKLTRFLGNNIRCLLALICLGGLVAASLYLPQVLVRWQNDKIIGVFHPQAQQQPEQPDSSLSLSEKLTLLSGGVFYSGLQSYFSEPLPYWLDLDYNYAAVEQDYQLAIQTSASITISPLLTGNRYTPKSALEQCHDELQKLQNLGLLQTLSLTGLQQAQLVPEGEQWQTTVQPLLYLSRSVPAHSLIGWHIRLERDGQTLWVTLDDDSGQILYLQLVDGALYNVALMNEGPDTLQLWAQYWGVALADLQESYRNTPHRLRSQYTAQFTALFQDGDEQFLFSAQSAQGYFTFGALTTDLNRIEIHKKEQEREIVDTNKNPPVVIVHP